MSRSHAEACCRGSHDASASTPGALDWPRFLMVRPWGRKLVEEETVISLCLVCRGSAPALEVTTEAHPDARYITFKGGKFLERVSRPGFQPPADASTLGLSAANRCFDVRLNRCLDACTCNS